MRRGMHHHRTTMKYHESIYVNESVPKGPKKSAGNTKLCGLETDIADVLDVSYHIKMTGRSGSKLADFLRMLPESLSVFNKPYTSHRRDRHNSGLPTGEFGAYHAPAECIETTTPLFESLFLRTWDFLPQRLPPIPTACLLSGSGYKSTRTFQDAFSRGPTRR